MTTSEASFGSVSRSSKLCAWRARWRPTASPSNKRRGDNSRRNSQPRTNSCQRISPNIEPSPARPANPLTMVGCSVRSPVQPYRETLPGPINSQLTLTPCCPPVYTAVDITGEPQLVRCCLNQRNGRHDPYACSRLGAARIPLTFVSLSPCPIWLATLRLAGLIHSPPENATAYTHQNRWSVRGSIVDEQHHD